MIPTAISAEVVDKVSQLSCPQSMRRGTLSERYVKCSKPRCGCRQDADARHGPYYSLTRGVGGKTQTRLLSAQQAAMVRRQIAAGQKFRREVERYWEVCERAADQELAEPPAAPEEAAEKKGSKRTSKKNSAKRSTRS